MNEKSIIIIGAGLAGLSVGCYAQMNGYSSQIFEHHSVPGGVAACWKRKGYLIDGGIHFLMGHKPGTSIYDMYRELGIAQAVKTIDVTVYMRFLDQSNGRIVDVTSDLDRFADELKHISPIDSGIIDEIIAGARRMQGMDMGEAGMSKPPELMGKFDQVGMIWNMRRVAKYMFGKFAKPVDEYVQDIQDPCLREIIRSSFLPEVPVWFLFMLFGMVADGQLGLLEDGSINFVLPIEKRYKDLGGQVTYKATVDEILIENNHAVGIRLADGSEHRADVIVSAADGYSTIFKMLHGLYVNDEIVERYNNWKLIRPIATVSFGINREFKDEPWLSMVILESPIEIGNEQIEGIMFRLFNYSDKFSPPGKTTMVVAFETEWDYWNELQQDRPKYDAEKERVIEEIKKRIEAIYPGVSSQIEMTDMATPYTTWRFTRNYKGAYEGWLPTPETINTQIKRTLPGLDSFYMAGQWVLPGGGVPPCLYSGRHVVQILCKKDRKKFTSSFA